MLTHYTSCKNAPVLRGMSRSVRFGLAITGACVLSGSVFAESGSVLDIFPESGVSSTPGTASCSFEYTPSGSDWNPEVKESQVFLASFQGDGWQLGVGKGGHIYSLRGLYGESVPPQRKVSPWNDEVWQTVVTSEGLVGPMQDYQNGFSGEERAKVWNETYPLMYFVHQAGIYTKGAGIDGGGSPAPFYSPCLRKRWNPETRTLELVNWMQQARTPCVWKSGMLIYTAYRDLGEGILEVNQVLHNFGDEGMTFVNTPWGGVRNSSLPHPVMSNVDGSWEAADGVYGWTDIPTRNLVDTGGWMAWTQNSEDEKSPSLALVFGTDANDVSNGKRKDEAIRWGMAGSGEAAKIRDYQVAERMGHPVVRSGDSFSIRWYLVSGEFAQVRTSAAKLAEKSGIWPMSLDATTQQSVWIADGKLNTDGKGDLWGNLNALPAPGTVPVFLLEDKRTGQQMITADPYALAETEPFPNSLPASYEGREIYDNRVIYRQYAPHIGYENLLGFALSKKPSAGVARKLEAPQGVELHPSAQELWLAVPRALAHGE